MTLDDIQRRKIVLILRFFTEFRSFAGQLPHSG